MRYLAEKFFNFVTYGTTFAGIAVNFESIKSVILFVLAFVLLIMQIILHWIRIKKERER